MAEKTAKENALEIAQILEDGKAENVTVIDVSELNSWTDFFVIGTIHSSAHWQGLAKQVKDYVAENELEIHPRSAKRFKIAFISPTDIPAFFASSLWFASGRLSNVFAMLCKVTTSLFMISIYHKSDFWKTGNIQIFMTDSPSKSFPAIFTGFDFPSFLPSMMSTRESKSSVPSFFASWE